MIRLASGGLLRLILILAAGVLLALPVWLPMGSAGGVLSYAVFMLLPGVVLYALLEKRTSAVEALSAAVVLSPVISTALAVLLMVAGTSPDTAGRTVIMLVVFMGVITFSGIRGSAGGNALAGESTAGQPVTLSKNQWFILGGCILVTLFLAGYLPLTNEWWRFRSDAWFHRAVIFQIQDFGLPPEDPYFAGFNLQYMWFYHVLVLVLSRLTSLDPFYVMPIINLQAVVGIYFATLLFAGNFVARFTHRIWSCLMVVFGLNAAFWLYIPLKVARALTGEVRGTEELARIFTLSPFVKDTTEAFVRFGIYSDDLLFEKLMVATAHVLGFCLMALFWHATTSYLKTRRVYPLITAGVSLAGMFAFHTLFGLVMMAAGGGALGLLFVLRRRVEGFQPKPVLVLAGAGVLAVAAIAPYLYQITSQKGGAGASLLGLSFQKTVMVVITCTAVIILSAFQRKFFRGRSLTNRYVQYAIAVIAVLCVVLYLPGANILKLPFFLFYPLAVIGGWTIADVVARRRTAGGRTAASIAAFLIVLAPLNGLCITSYFFTPTPPMYTPDEQAVAAWVKANTEREAVFISRDDEVFLLNAGPRRYLYGRWSYALMWGYDPETMDARYKAREDLFGSDDLDKATLKLLAETPWPLYAVDHPSLGPTSLSRHAEFFTKMISSGDLEVYRVDKAACAEAAAE